MDADFGPNGQIHYFLHAGEDSSVNQLFAVDIETGILSVQSSVTFAGTNFLFCFFNEEITSTSRHIFTYKPYFLKVSCQMFAAIEIIKTISFLVLMPAGVLS